MHTTDRHKPGAMSEIVVHMYMPKILSTCTTITHLFLALSVICNLPAGPGIRLLLAPSFPTVEEGAEAEFTSLHSERWADLWPVSSSSLQDSSMFPNGPTQVDSLPPSRGRLSQVSTAVCFLFFGQKQRKSRLQLSSTTYAKKDGMDIMYETRYLELHFINIAMNSAIHM